MDIDERKQKIIEMLNKNSKVKVNELSELFKISEVTIRMDLADLEAKGLLSRVHGGAVSSYRTYFNMNLQQRLNTNQSEKQAIAEEVAKMIKEQYKPKNIYINMVGPVIGSHSGPGTISVFYMATGR